MESISMRDTKNMSPKEVALGKLILRTGRKSVQMRPNSLVSVEDLLNYYDCSGTRFLSTEQCVEYAELVDFEDEILDQFQKIEQDKSFDCDSNETVYPKVLRNHKVVFLDDKKLAYTGSNQIEIDFLSRWSKKIGFNIVISNEQTKEETNLQEK